MYHKKTGIKKFVWKYEFQTMHIFREGRLTIRKEGYLVNSSGNVEIINVYVLNRRDSTNKKQTLQDKKVIQSNL